MSDEIPLPGPCKACGADDALAMPYEPFKPYDGIGLWFYVQCRGCGVSTPMRPTHSAAVNFWNAAAGEGAPKKPKRTR